MADRGWTLPRELLAGLLLLALAGCASTPATSPPTADPGPEPAAEVAERPATEDAEDDAPAPEISIPYEKFVLDNGLRLIVHEDRKAPIVAVNVWYHVGSKNEEPGKTGFAHLFEHLMFNGSENHDDDYFLPFDRVGATEMNGTTNPDRTNYFQNVPKSALDMALWMESDRMGHLLGAVGQDKLDEQRGVVQNEKRQGENQPYGVTRQLITENTYPDEHPYSWSTIGSMEDLDAAELEDVREWFRTYYGAANAVIVVAGDIDPEVARARVETYFGDIPSGPPVARHDTWIAKRSGTHRQRVQDRVPQARIYKVWNVPEWGSTDGIHLQMAARILGSGKTSRFYERLVYEDQIATDAIAFANLREIAGQFQVRATARPDGDLAEVEAALDEEMERFLAEGPSAEELELVKTQVRAGFIRGVERVGGFGGKSDVLAESEVYGGSPDAYEERLRVVREATVEDLREAARTWLSDGVYVLEVTPYPDYGTVASEVDRSDGVPGAGEPPTAEFPELHRTTLSNGLEVILAHRDAVPVVNFQLLFDAGYASDPAEAAGTADLAMNLLDEGTSTRSALEVSEELARLGANLGTGSNLDGSTVSFSALLENLDPSLELFADVVLRPAFPEEEVRRLKQEQLASIQREQSTPILIVQRVLPGLLYGSDHAYGNPMTGSGTEASVRGLTREDLAGFHDRWLRPDNATLVVVGPVTLEELTPRLERLFGDWEPGEVPSKRIDPVEHRAEPAVYLIDRPGAQQSLIFAGHVAPPKSNPREVAIEAMNTILGGSFSARMNMNLREDKHWSYGARTLLFDAEGQRPFVVYAPVQTDRTVESMQEILYELEGIRGERPATPEELAKAKDLTILTLPGRWETARAIGSDIAQMVRFGLDEDHYRTLPDRVRALGLEDVSEVAADVIRPDRLVWVVVGDRDEVEEGIREANFGEVRLLDGDGNPVDGEARAAGAASDG